MAFTDLIPQIQVCFTEDCSTLKITDITGLYNASTNPNGWQGNDTVDTGDISTATIKIKHSSEDEYTEYDVIDVVNTADPNITSEFEIGDFTVTTGDGCYTIIYTLTQTVDDVTSTLTDEVLTYSLCGVRCCVDKLWLKVAQGLVEECGCATASYDKATKAESYINSIKASSSVGDYTTADSLLEKLQTICTKENCNCN